MIRRNNYRPLLAKSTSNLRRPVSEPSPKAFAENYLKSHYPHPDSSMHTEIFERHHTANEDRDAKIAIAAPRGHAKSTIVSLAYILWCVLYGKEDFVLIVSNTKEQAASLLSPIAEQFQVNQTLITDFPEVCQPEGAGKKPAPWRGNKIRLRNDAMIASYGAGQRLRGVKNGKARPGLIVADDLENLDQVIVEEQREKLGRWFSGTLLRAGHPGTNVIVVGTILHHDSLLANLIDNSRRPNWTGSKYRAVVSFSSRPGLWEQWSTIFRGQKDYEERSGKEAAKEFLQDHTEEMLEGTEVLWPELEDYPTLMIEREDSQISFQAEKQNEPLDPDQCIFSEHKFQYWDDDYDGVPELLASLGRNGYFYGACDPSLGHRKDRGDYSAIIVLYQERHTRINYVIAADLARRSPDDTIERILHYAKQYRFHDFGVETNQFQEMMVSNLERRARNENIRISIYDIKSRSNKRSRIANLEPEVCQGNIRFCRRHQLLLDQLKQFPLAKHDDGPDALEMAMEIANQPRNRVTSRFVY